MTIVLTGGGTGGHITPLLAVAHELKRLQPDVRIVYIGERGGKFSELTRDSSDIDEIHTIFAGKFRRYHGESWFMRLLDVKTNLLNIRDLFYFLIGTVQSWLLLGRIRPDTIMLKGGFVGVPVGLSAAARRIPFLTHDSDILPGLANRLVGRWAELHAVAQPVEYYHYPHGKMRQVGVILEPNFAPVTEVDKQKFKAELGLKDDPVLLITGGSSGAKRINEAIVKLIDTLLADYPNLQVIHQAGKGKTGVYGAYTHPRLTVLEFMRPMHVYTGAADVVVARASANTLAELGWQGKATIVIASRYLAGGHQLKNAEILENKEAALTLAEGTHELNVEMLDAAIRQLLDDITLRQKLAERLQSLTIPDAAEKIALLLLDLKK